MKRSHVTIAIGIWIIVLPFLGFPPLWDRWLLILTGIVLIALSVKKISPAQLFRKRTEEPPVGSL